ncbi:hypothetical protein U5817_12520 [Aromatoleum evansii]|uniref:Uncharacterized protein n=1 Tax=Aromatoleum evansii TaxID=59406 RepID=A0ABZ1ASI1_AROEV|nr:hypothetical protein U5817_12520 [Aromatoleum evansii]
MTTKSADIARAAFIDTAHEAKEQLAVESDTAARRGEPSGVLLEGPRGPDPDRNVEPDSTDKPATLLRRPPGVWVKRPMTA